MTWHGCPLTAQHEHQPLSLSQNENYNNNELVKPSADVHMTPGGTVGGVQTGRIQAGGMGDTKWRDLGVLTGQKARQMKRIDRLLNNVNLQQIIH